MSPSAIREHSQHEDLISTADSNGVGLANGYIVPTNGSAIKGFNRTQFLFDRNLHKAFPIVTGGEGNWLHLADGRKVFDATSGAAVSCLGHKNQRVIDALCAQIKTGVPYLASTFWSYEGVDDLCEELVNGTGGLMDRVYLTGSGLSLNRISERTHSSLDQVLRRWKLQSKCLVNSFTRVTDTHGE
jgi:hypothetical protein